MRSFRRRRYTTAKEGIPASDRSEPHGVRVERTQALLRFDDEAVVILIGELSRSATSSQSICSMAPIPAVRQKRSKELSTSCQAVSRLGTSASDEGVVIVVMALLSFADSTPRA